MIKIIHVISSLRRGGRERQLATIVSYTDYEKYPTKIIYFNSCKDSYIDEYDLHKHLVKLDSRDFFLRLFQLNKMIKDNKPDVVYTWGILESLFILIIRLFQRFEFVNGSIRHGIRSKKFSHYFRTALLHLSPHVVANSYAGLKANNLKRGFVLYNGIDEKFVTPLENRTVKRNDLVNIPESTLIFISVARLVPYKDYYTVIRALEKIKELYVDFHYLILGDGPLRKKLEGFIRKSGLENNLTIFRHVENVHEYLKISDVFIHSSKGEGCSNAILEAMAAGLPVVASNTGGTPEIVSESNGFLFQYKCDHELTNILRNCMENQYDLKILGHNSKEIIKNQFRASYMIKNFYKIINKVLYN